ncbi:virulence factor MviN [[Clostridium] sordellii]|uniref:murein biosynthesis integral membrane protein MurJ n=1 Tax=Paraclostridium sordellii TaxID=1505 RepID=UPI0005DCD861|nr:murein biosynthesis integral membrane protein MurJ [Paeniclostridium sordellii]MDU7966198.1 murein biosynthesis integral membrane protein MurJ [Paeniclostridium sordellii]CEQ25151.1 virulence factor MviN [[Clostridium] sordellii] [Paeniclostridium sordellii]
MSKIAKNTALIMILGVFCKVIGFGRDQALTALYGINGYGGIYLAVSSIPDIIFALVGTCIITTFIPMHYEIKSIDGEERANKFLNNVFNITIVVSFFITLFGMIFPDILVKVFAMGLKGSQFNTAVKFTQILMIGGFFTGISGVITAFLNINEEFVIPTIVSLPFNIISIVSIFISIKTSPYVMVIGISIGLISKFLIQIIYAYKKGYRYKFKIDIKDKYLRKMMILLIPILIGVAVNQVNSAVDNSMATNFGVGCVSAISYAGKLNSFIMGIFTVSLTSVIYPKLSELLVDKNKDGFVSIITKSINLVIIFILPVSAGAIILSSPIVSILFEKGRFDSNATYMTALALSGYSVGMIAYSLRDILGKIFYSLKDTKTPMINGIIAVILNIIMDIYFSKVFGYAGLTLATSISSIVCIITLFISLHKKAGYFGQDKIFSTLIKSLISVIIMSFTVKFVFNNMSNLIDIKIIDLSVSILAGGFVYLGLMYILKVDELNMILEIVIKYKEKLISSVKKEKSELI